MKIWYKLVFSTSSTFKSMSDTLFIGTRTDVPTIFPSSSGIILQIEDDAPVVWGIILFNIERFVRLLEWAVSTTFWLAVDACIVVKFACLIPNISFKCFKTGTIELVVHDALLIIFSLLYSL